MDTYIRTGRPLVKRTLGVLGPGGITRVRLAYQP